jgi:hypothetical protein
MAEEDSGESGAASGGAGASGAYPGTGAAYGGQGQAVAIPEKYQVKTEGGALDVEASSLKLAEAYRTLEKRVGTGDMRPNSADEYTIPVPDDMKELFDPKTDPLIGDFLKDAHEAGMTQGQIDFVLGKYFEVAPQLVGGSQQMSAEACNADLRKDWATDEQYKAEVGKAFKAAQAFGDKDAEAIMQKCDNDPRIIRLLARVGAELGEDRSIGHGARVSGAQSVQSVMTSEAYTNPKHPDHARVSAQVQGYFARQAKES